MKVSTGDAAADVYEDDALVDTDSRTKLEQLVQMLHKEAEVSRWFFFKDLSISVLCEYSITFTKPVARYKLYINC